MPGRVIQGFFPGGQPRPLPGAATSAPLQRRTAPAAARPGPPAPAFAHAAVAAIQRHGGHGGMAIDPVQLGLVRNGGAPLPAPVLTKMEAAFGADFSAVRVHVGPQAARIGAVAFTTGNDLYFAPGQYQPDTVKGQQLIGHELAHVIQQRQGRVAMPMSGVAVVQDHMLEAEADRLGMRAASMPVQRRAAPGSPGPAPVPPGRPAPIQRAPRPAAAAPRPGPPAAAYRAASAGRPIQRKVEIKLDKAKNCYQIYGRPDFTSQLKRETFDEADVDGETYFTKYSDNNGLSFELPTIHRRHKLAWSLWRAGVNTILEYGDVKDLRALMKDSFVSAPYKTWTAGEFKDAWSKGKYLESMSNDFFNNKNNIWLGPGNENVEKGGGVDKKIINYISNPSKKNRKTLKEAAFDPHDKFDFSFLEPTTTHYGGWQFTVAPPSPRSHQMGATSDLILDLLSDLPH